jgi:hypothetical protein
MEENRMIAAFMGAKYYEAWECPVYGWPEPVYDFGEPENYPTKDCNRCWEPYLLRYDTDWNWLMPVVEKIESLGYNVDICQTTVDIFKKTNWNDEVVCKKEASKLEAVYSAVLSFLKWYNENQIKNRER